MSRQVQSLITTYCFAPKLAHLVRVLPPFVVRDHLQKLERVQVQVYDELTGCKIGGVLRKRAILSRRFGGVVPGVSPVVEAAHVASAMLFEAFITEHVGRAE